MSLQKVTATRTDTDREVSVDYDFGDDLASAVEKFGEETIYNAFKKSAVIDLQALIRRNMVAKEGEEAKTDDEIQSLVNEWKPSDKARVTKSATDKVMDIWEGVSDEEKAAILEKLAQQEQAA